MNREHIIGGVRMILHEGEVYARLIDIIDVAENDKQIQITGENRPLVPSAAIEEPKPRGRKPKVEKKPKGKKKCGNCGEYGHQARTCAFSSTSPGTKKAVSLKELVQESIDAGEGFEAICMSHPSIPSAAISRVYKELTAGS